MYLRKWRLVDTWLPNAHGLKQILTCTWGPVSLQGCWHSTSMTLTVQSGSRPALWLPSWPILDRSFTVSELLYPHRKMGKRLGSAGELQDSDRASQELSTLSLMWWQFTVWWLFLVIIFCCQLSFLKWARCTWTPNSSYIFSEVPPESYLRAAVSRRRQSLWQWAVCTPSSGKPGELSQRTTKKIEGRREEGGRQLQ